MQYCSQCKVHISTKTDFCPLCHQKLKGNKQDLVQTFPEFTKPIKNSLAITRLVLNIVAPLLIFVSVLINLLTFNGVLWSLIDTLAIIYLWMFGLWSFKKDVNIGRKIVANAIAITLLLVGINIFGYNLATLPNELWSITYVVPFFIASVLLVNNIFMFTKRYRIKDFLLSQFSLSFMAIALSIVMVCGLTSVIYPAIIVLSLAGATVLTFAIIGNKALRTELAKKFHM